MDKDLLLLIKNIRQAKDLDDLERLQDLSGTVLRSQKREAIISLLAISEELGKDEIPSLKMQVLDCQTWGCTF